MGQISLSISKERNVKGLFFQLLIVILAFSSLAFAKEFKNPYAQKCWEESSAWHDNEMEFYCGSIRSSFELRCLRLTKRVRSWKDACPGVNDSLKMDCIDIIFHGHGYADELSLAWCRNVSTAEQIECIRKTVTAAWLPVSPRYIAKCILSE